MIGGCEIGVIVHAATDHAWSPLGWRLFMPESESWDNTCAETDEQAEAIPARRSTVQLPEQAPHPRCALKPRTIRHLQRSAGVGIIYQ